MTSDGGRAARILARKVVDRVPPLRRRLLSSCDYSRDLAHLDRDGGSGAGWSSMRMARRQDRVWRRLIHEALAGRPRADVDAVVAALNDLLPNGGSMVEVGCGSGYFSELIGGLCSGISYQGLDASEAMLSIARAEYPDGLFLHGTASATGLPDGSVDVVLDGAALIHVPDWRAALEEYRRIASRGVILSSLTISEERESVLFSKYAYGSLVVESVFSRADLTRQLEQFGLEVVGVVQTLPYDLQDRIGIKSTSELWVCC